MSQVRLALQARPVPLHLSLVLQARPVQRAQQVLRVLQGLQVLPDLRVLIQQLRVQRDLRVLPVMAVLQAQPAQPAQQARLVLRDQRVRLLQSRAITRLRQNSLRLSRQASPVMLTSSVRKRSFTSGIQT